MTTLLYVAQTHGSIKIGVTSSSLEKRMKSLQTGCPFPIEEVFYTTFNSRENAFMFEKMIHTIFKKFNTSGEWFKDVPKFQKKIEKLVGQPLTKISYNSYKMTEKDIQTRENKKIIKKEFCAVKERANKAENIIKRLNKTNELLKRAKKNNPLLDGINNTKLLSFMGVQ